MGFILAFLFVALAIAALILYGGTPHGGPTVSCGPIQFFGSTIQKVDIDCRYLSVGELAAAALGFFFGLLSALVARPKR
jgi:hypothetical protein